MRTVDGVEMVDVREAAALARRTPETIRRWVWSGRIPARRDGRRLLVARTDLLRLIGDNEADHVSGRAASSYPLRDWVAELVRTNPGGRSGSTASDLVFADRSQRSGDAGR
jgi:excisionase family DNA binding protein